MNGKRLLIALLALVAAASCIKPEAPNAEADITGCTLAGDVLNREPVIENDKVTLYLKKGVPVTALAPEFTLTPGATIAPASGTVLDFSEPQIYVVTSEDRRWEKSYTVTVSTEGMTLDTFSFENARTDSSGRYQIFFESDASGKEILTWASGNAGYAMTGSGSSFTDYPTYQSAEGEGYGGSGKCAVMVTRRTGSFGTQVNMPIASGSLFIGTFDAVNAIKSPLTATKFGIQYEHKPAGITGYYKYRSGDEFYELDVTAANKLKLIPGRRDMFNIYAVFYESTEAMPTVDGTNALSPENPNVLATAEIDPAKYGETDVWSPFELTFEWRAGKEVDPVKLAAGKYNFAVVFASSTEGDYFSGAPGSMLCIDEVKLEYTDL